jgi:hypothetical protein
MNRIVINSAVTGIESEPARPVRSIGGSKGYRSAEWLLDFDDAPQEEPLAFLD